MIVTSCAQYFTGRGTHTRAAIESFLVPARSVLFLVNVHDETYGIEANQCVATARSTEHGWGEERRGLLLRRPEIGRRLVILLGGSRRMLSSRIREITAAACGELIVQTKSSVYRLRRLEMTLDEMQSPRESSPVWPATMVV